MKNEIDLSRRLALGGLLQGYFHNLKGTLQGLFLELQILFMKKDPNCGEEVYQRLKRIFEQLQKLQKQIDTAFDNIYDEKRGPWDLKEIIEKEIIFWESDLFFKHKIKKEIKEEKKEYIEMPYNLLRGLLCNIAQELFLHLQENTNLKIFIKENKKVEFVWDKNVNSKVYKSLEKLAEKFKEIVNIEIKENSLALNFKNG